MPAFLVAFRGSVSAADIAALRAEGIIYDAGRSDDGVPSFRVRADDWREASERVGSALDRRLVDYGSLAVTGSE
jgi:hypothetical protein